MSAAVMYSQQEEETYILKHTPATGRFCDIGAYHAKDLSNTRALYERGWGGVFVEPSPGACYDLLTEYGGDNRVVLVSALIGPERDLKPLRIHEGPYSTSHADTFERGVKSLYLGPVWIPQLTIQDLIDHWGPFDFINIDVEGGSVDLLRSLFGCTVARMPACICVEHDGRIPEAVQIAQHQYYLAYDNSTNLIFAKK